MCKILVGCDPEVFVKDTSTNKFINAYGMVQGTKEFPYPVKDGAIQVDGMALEFNINPASTLKEFQHNIQSVKNRLYKEINNSQYSIEATPSVFFSKKDMDEAPMVSKMLGCEEDYNAWLGEPNPPPDACSNLRTGAGHIHIGWTEGEDIDDMNYFNYVADLTKQFDCSLGIQSILWDEDSNRRRLYGRAGAFRVKHYGVEYRVLSNVWLNSKDLISHVYNTTIKSVEDFFDGIHYYDEINPVDVINNGNINDAKMFTSLMYDIYGVKSYV